MMRREETAFNGFPAMISTARGFLFVHVPKTAGNAIQNALRPFADDRFVVASPAFQDGWERYELRHVDYPTLHKHSRLEDYRRALPRPLYRRLFKAGCVRNPWERAISYYFSPHRGQVEWDREAFLALLPSIAPAFDYLRAKGRFFRRLGVDMVLRYEHLEADFARFCDRLGLGALALPRVNVSARRDHRAYYDDELIAAVARRHADDIRHFGYSFD